MLDIRGSEGSEVATCENPSQICCLQENSDDNAVPMTPEVDKETPSEEFDYYDTGTVLCETLASEGYRYIQNFHRIEYAIHFSVLSLLAASLETNARLLQDYLISEGQKVQK